MSETGRGKKRNRKKKERNIILMRDGNKKYYLSLALSYRAQTSSHRWLCIVAEQVKFLPILPPMLHTFLYMMVLKIAF